jgi:hypothetical protein
MGPVLPNNQCRTAHPAFHPRLAKTDEVRAEPSTHRVSLLPTAGLSLYFSSLMAV